MIIPTLAAFALSAIVLHVVHARIARSHPKIAEPAGRVLLEIAPTTILARRLSKGEVSHPLALLYRVVWYVHIISGLAFALSLTLSAFFALR